MGDLILQMLNGTFGSPCLISISADNNFEDAGFSSPLFEFKGFQVLKQLPILQRGFD